MYVFYLSKFYLIREVNYFIVVCKEEKLDDDKNLEENVLKKCLFLNKLFRRNNFKGKNFKENIRLLNVLEEFGNFI